MLELADRGFDPEATIADGAGGLRAGQEQALPGVPCRGDVFHCLYEVGPLVRYLENRAYDAMDAVEKLKRQQKRHQRSKGRKNLSVVRRLHLAETAEAKAITLADDVATLARWLQGDILAVAGPPSRLGVVPGFPSHGPRLRVVVVKSPFLTTFLYCVN